MSDQTTESRPASAGQPEHTCLAKVEALQTAALDRLALNAAETSAQRGGVALTRLRYAEAAQHFAKAASHVPGGHDDKRLAYLAQEAEALYRQGG